MELKYSAKKLFLYFIIFAVPALLVYLVHYKNLPTWRMFTDMRKEEQHSINFQESNRTNRLNDPVVNAKPLDTGKQAVRGKKLDISKKSENYHKGTVSEIQKEWKPDYSSTHNSSNSFTLGFSGGNIVTTGDNSRKLTTEKDISWTSKQMETTISKRIGFSVSTNVSLLADILHKKLRSVNASQKVNNFKPTCESDFNLANSCDNNKCLQTELPDDVTARVEQLVTPQKLQMSPEEHEILSGMADKVTGNYDVILLTATSSNHFMESQALLKNIHENVYPHMKNFTLVFYNLGLTEQERILLVKYCKCQVIDFPFHKFPSFTKTLKCYTWKPIMIKSHLRNANVVFWMDASIRFNNSSKDLDQLIQTARERGVQIGDPSEKSPFRTHRSMYHFFGDEPCAYLYFEQVKATFGVYHREHFVDRAILEPWVACALNENCMCLEGKTSLSCGRSISMAAKYYRKEGPIVYGLCHRFDQSAISLILHKLYQDRFQWLTFKEAPVLAIVRGDSFPYFESIMKNETGRISNLT